MFLYLWMMKLPLYERNETFINHDKSLRGKFNKIKGAFKMLSLVQKIMWRGRSLSVVHGSAVVRENKRTPEDPRFVPGQGQSFLNIILQWQQTKSAIQLNLDSA